MFTYIFTALVSGFVGLCVGVILASLAAAARDNLDEQQMFNKYYFVFSPDSLELQSIQIITTL